MYCVHFVFADYVAISPPRSYGNLSLPPPYQGGRQLLLDAALKAIKVAEDPETENDRLLMARSFHTATVYLEVLSSFNAVSPGAYLYTDS